jgi:predicted Zn-dependent protease
MSGEHGIGGDPEEALRLAERVIQAAEKAGAGEAEAVVAAGESSLTRFANSEIHQNVASNEAFVNLRFVQGRRVGVASSGRVDDEGIAALVERAAAIAENVEELEDWAGLPSAEAPEPVVDGWSERTAHASPELRAEGVRAVIAAADEAGVTAYGSFSTDAEAIAVANSKGIRAAERRTTSQLLTVTMGPDNGTGYAEHCAVDATTIDAAAIGREAAERARTSANPVDIEPGDYPVVLHHYAVVDLLDMLGYLGFSALAVQEDRSFFEPGKRVASPLVTITDDGHDPAGLPMGFDAEGVPKQRLALLDKGVCCEVVYDAQTAARDGRSSTGHGLPAPNPYGPFPTNMVMAGGDASFEELVGGLDRGLLVTRFHYTNPVHPKLAIVTGMTRDGTFLVEGGTVVGPVKNLRYTQSYLAALAGTVAVASDRKTLKGFLGGVVVPAIRVDGWTFTGATEH